MAGLLCFTDRYSYLYVAANEDTVAPASEEVPPPPPTEAAEYLPFESSQLTPDVIANLTNYQLSDVEQFDFEDPATASSKRAGRSCKAFPGENNWPNDVSWRVLDLLTGLTLIDGVPPASACYPEWSGYDEGKCKNITAKWTTPQYQYVPAHAALQSMRFFPVECHR